MRFFRSVMTKILLYGSIYSYSASDFIQQVQAAGADDICVYVNCNGGDPQDMYGMARAFAEHKGNKEVQIDGKANSSALYFICYANHVEALDVSEFVLHRASYGAYFENSPELFDEDAQKRLANINKNLRAAFENKIDVKKFEKITGKKLDDVFSMDQRIDVIMTAEQALAIGLIDEIITLTPDITEEVNERVEACNSKNRIAALSPTVQATAAPTSTNKTPNKMTAQELKEKYPAVYAEIFNAGVAAELDRVQACLTFIEIDPAGVKAAVDSGKPLSQKQMAEFAQKQIMAASLKTLEEKSPGTIATTEQPLVQTDAQKAQAAKEAEEAKFLATALPGVFKEPATAGK